MGVGDRREFRLSLSALRQMRSDLQARYPAHTPPLAQDRNLEAVSGIEALSLTRRQFIYAAALSPFVLPSNDRPWSFRRSYEGVDVISAGAVRWRIRCKDFAGQPKLSVADFGDRAEIRLSDARYPGTRLNADLYAVFEIFNGRWRMVLKLYAVGAVLRADLVKWLLRDAPAVGRRKGPPLHLVDTQRGSVVVPRRATLEFTPIWNLNFNAPNGIELIVDDKRLVADAVRVSRPPATQNPLVRSGSHGRTWLTVPRSHQPWAILPKLQGAGWRILSDDRAVYQARIETGEERNSLNIAATFQADVGTSMRFESARIPNKESADLPVTNVRYAVPLSSIRRSGVMVADFQPDPKWVRFPGVALKLGAVANGQPLEILAERDEVRAVRGAPGLFGVAVSQLDPDAQVGAVEMEGTPISLVPAQKVNFWKRLACRLNLSDDCAEICIPMHGGRVPISRSEDLLQLEIEIRHARFETRNGHAYIKPEPGDTKPLLLVHFPPQHVLEEAFYERPYVCPTDRADPDRTQTGNCTPAFPTEPHAPPVRALLSGPSRLVFELPSKELPFAASTLLDWTGLALKVSSRATPPGLANVGAVPTPVGDAETLIELPTRVYLSPHSGAAWMTSNLKGKPNKGKWIELWHTRLATKRQTSTGEGTVADEWNRADATLRALWTPGYVNGCLPSHDSLPFASTLDHRDRVEFVDLTSNFKMPAPGVCPGSTDRGDQGGAGGPYYLPKPIGTEHLLLSSMGGWLRSQGSWDPPMNASGQALTVEHWEHRALMARDHYVKVIYRAFLVPLGVGCVLVKITERKMQDIGGYTDGPLGLLRQRYQIVIREDYKKYPALAQQNGGRRWPFRAVRFEKGYTTPILDFPADISAFFPGVGCKDLLFPFELETHDGRRIPCSAPLFFIDATVAYADCSKALISPHGPSCTSDCPSGARGKDVDYWSIWNDSRNESRQKWYLHDGPVTYAPSKQRGDTQFETEYIQVWADKPDWNTPIDIVGCDATVADTNKARLCLALFRDKQAPVYPALSLARVRIPAVEQLTRQSQYVDIGLHERFIANGFAEAQNPGEIFAQFTKAVPLTFNGRNESGDKAGGVISPNVDLIGLSRKAGPVGGSGSPERYAKSLDVTASGEFNPRQYFGAGLDGAKLLGGIRLVDVLPAASSLNEAPKVVRRILGLELQEFHQVVNTILDSVLDRIVADDGVAYLKTRIQADVSLVRQEIQNLSTTLPAGDTAEGIAQTLAILAQQEEIVSTLRRISDTIRAGLENLGAIANDQLVQWHASFVGQLLPQWETQLTEIKRLLPQTAEQAVLVLVAKRLEGTFDKRWLGDLPAARGRLEATLSGLIEAAKSVEVVEGLRTMSSAARALDDMRERCRRVSDGLAVVAKASDIERVLRDFVEPKVPIQTYLDERAKLEMLVAEVLKGIEAGSVRENVKRAYLTLRDIHIQLEAEVRELDVSEPVQLVMACGLLQRTQGQLALAIGKLADAVSEARSRTSSIPRTEWRYELGTTAGDKAKPLAAVPELLKLIQSWNLQFTTASQINERRIDALRQALVVGGPVNPLRRLSLRADELAEHAKTLAAVPADSAAAISARLNAAADFAAVFTDALVSLRGTKEQVQLLADISGTLDGFRKDVDAELNAVRTIAAGAKRLVDDAPAVVRAQLSRRLAEAVVDLDRLDVEGREVLERGLFVIALTLQNLRALHDDLMTSLGPTIEDAQAMIGFTEQLASQLGALLKPLRIELTYTWTPEVQAGPGDTGIFEPNNRRGLTIDSRIVSRLALSAGTVSDPEFAIVGRLVDFKINLLDGTDPYITVPIESLVFRSHSGSGPTCEVTIGDLTLGSCLEFISKLAEWLGGDSGFFVRPGLTEIVTGFKFGSSYIPLGGLILQNVRFETSFRIRYNGDPFRVVFSLSSKRDPFLMSVGIYGGTGYVRMALGADGIEAFSLGFSFGLVGGVQIGPLVAQGQLTAGIGIDRVESGIELTGFVEAAGQLSLVGFSVSAYAYLGLRYSDNGACEGEVIVEITISVFMFHFSIRFEMHRQFSGRQAATDGGGGRRAKQRLAANGRGYRPSCWTNENAEASHPIEWDEYFDAFAA